VQAQEALEKLIPSLHEAGGLADTAIGRSTLSGTRARLSGFMDRDEPVNWTALDELWSTVNSAHHAADEGNTRVAKAVALCRRACQSFLDNTNES
jgi:hypothetical protein